MYPLEYDRKMMQHFGVTLFSKEWVLKSVFSYFVARKPLPTIVQRGSHSMVRPRGTPIYARKLHIEHQKVYGTCAAYFLYRNKVYKNTKAQNR